MNCVQFFYYALDFCQEREKKERKGEKKDRMRPTCASSRCMRPTCAFSKCMHFMCSLSALEWSPVGHHYDFFLIFFLKILNIANSTWHNLTKNLSNTQNHWVCSNAQILQNSKYFKFWILKIAPQFRWLLLFMVSL